MKVSKKERWYMMVVFAPFLLSLILKSIKYVVMALIGDKYSMDFDFVDYWLMGAALIVIANLVEFSYRRMRDDFLNDDNQ